MKEWPSSGPPVVWTADGLGNGYGSMAVAGERVFVQGTRGGNSVVMALNRADGKEVWSKALGRSSDDDRGPGPRGTPTVDGDRALRPHRERRSRVPQDRRRGGVAAQHPEGLRRQPVAVADQRVAAGRRRAPSCQPRRPGRRHGEAGQDDREDGVAVERSQRCGRLLVAPSSPTCRASGPI